MNFSLEIGLNADLEALPPVKDVYITFLPGGDYIKTAEKAGDLVKKGFFPEGSNILYAHLGGAPALNGYSYTYRNG